MQADEPEAEFEPTAHGVATDDPDTQYELAGHSVAMPATQNLPAGHTLADPLTHALPIGHATHSQPLGRAEGFVLLRRPAMQMQVDPTSEAPKGQAHWPRL